MIDRIKKKYCERGGMSVWVFALLTTILYCCSVTLIEFSDQPIADIHSLMKTALLYGLVTAFTFGLFCFLSVWRMVYIIVMPLLMAFSAVMNYLTLTIGSRLSETSIEIALGNDAGMWWSVITPGLVASAIFGLAVGVIFSIVRVRYVKSSRNTRLWMGAGGLAMAVLAMTASDKIAWTVGNRLPYSIYYCFREYVKNKREAKSVRSTYDSTAVTAPADAPDIIFIIGESLRADHLPMNGYHRNTLPGVSSDSLLINFSDIYTPFTNTNIAVPHILTRYSAGNPEAAYSDQSFISLFKRAGYKTLWIANQNLTEAYAYFAYEADSLEYANSGKSIYHYDQTLDTDMLPILERYLSNKTDSAPHLIVMHAIGQHWWYPTHYTEEDTQFRPVVGHKEIAALSDEAIINSYDNTILATDRFLRGVQRIISDRNAIIFYISDHGELLGEDGCYLHDGDQAPLHRPACFMLPTPKYASKYPELIDSLRRSSKRRGESTLTFHTILRLGRLSTSVLNPDSTLMNL